MNKDVEFLNINWPLRSKGTSMLEFDPVTVEVLTAFLIKKIAIQQLYLITDTNNKKRAKARTNWVIIPIFIWRYYSNSICCNAFPSNGYILTYLVYYKIKKAGKLVLRLFLTYRYTI
jgi:hypothetical protein